MGCPVPALLGPDRTGDSRRAGILIGGSPRDRSDQKVILAYRREGCWHGRAIATTAPSGGRLAAHCDGFSPRAPCRGATTSGAVVADGAETVESLDALLERF